MAPATKRRRIEQPEEITFDPSARQEYLSGFHKRKQARIQNARETAAKRDKEEKVRERKQLREQRKEDLQRHVTEVNAELRKQKRDVADGSSDAEASEDEDGEFEGFDEAPKPVAEILPEDDEFVDEDKYTTVTVEAMDDQTESEEDGDDDEGVVEARTVDTAKGDDQAKAAAKKRIWSKDGQNKPKKKKFRYESKAERQATRQKQKSKNHKAKIKRTGK